MNEPDLSPDALFELFSSLCNRILSAESFDQLQRQLRTSPEARQAFIEFMQIESDLQWEHRAVFDAPGNVAPALHPDALATGNVPPSTSGLGFLAMALNVSASWLSSPKVLALGVAGGLLTYFLVLLISLAISNFRKADHDVAGAPDARIAGQISDRSPAAAVGSLTTDEAVRWSRGSKIPMDGKVRVGRRYELASGQLQIVLGRGVQLVIDGPATWQLESEERLQLELGKLVARVPARSIGFTVATPVGEVVDLGTEFGVTVAPGGKTEVHVIQGTVEVKQSYRSGRVPSGGVVVEAGKAVRMEARGGAPVPIAVQRREFAGALQKLPAHSGTQEILVLEDAPNAPGDKVSFQDGVRGYFGTRDTYIAPGGGSDPDTNYGTAAIVPVFEREPALNNFYRSLIGFDLTPLPPGTQVTGATVTLFVKTSTGNQGVVNSLHIVAEADKDWTETSATWNHKIHDSSTPWAGGPGLVAGTDYAATAAATATTPSAASAPMVFTLSPAGVEAIQHWIDHPEDNSGFFIRQPDGSASVDLFWSRDGAETGLHPVLTLSLTPAR